jgi:hypothetical protein
MIGVSRVAMRITLFGCENAGSAGAGERSRHGQRTNRMQFALTALSYR